MGEEAVRIVLVGHCRPDAFALRSAISSMIPGAAIEFSFDQASLRPMLKGATLLLVNRVLDGDYLAASGTDLVGELRREAPGTRVMLVSDLPEAQAEAVNAGALPGFGKRAMYAQETRQRIRQAVGLD